MLRANVEMKHLEPLESLQENHLVYSDFFLIAQFIEYKLIDQI